VTFIKPEYCISNFDEIRIEHNKIEPQNILQALSPLVSEEQNPLVAINSSGRLPRTPNITVRICNMEYPYKSIIELRALVDTGSEISLIKEELAKSFELKIYNTIEPIVLTQASGHTTTVTGIVCVTIEFFGKDNITYKNILRACYKIMPNRFSDRNRLFV